MSKSEIAFFSNRKPLASNGPAVFAADTRHPGVIHARVLYLLSNGRHADAVALVESRKEAVQDSTLELLVVHAAA